MALIIDGYNLLHAANLVGREVGPGGLERSRQALLDFLVASLEPQERAHTAVVFDAAKPPPGLPRVSEYQGIAVHFASAYEDADSLIEELIRADSAPRRLTVVSSDHRLHKAARRRKATAIDSDRWYAEILKRRAARTETRQVPKKPDRALTPAEVQQWMKELGESNAGASTKPPELDSPFPPGYAEDVEEDE